MRRGSIVVPTLGRRLSLLRIGSSNKSVLTLGSNARLALWLLVVTLELSTVALLCMWAGLYLTHRTHGSLLWIIKVYVLFHDAFEFLEHFGFVIAACYVAIASVFLYRVVRLLVASIQHRELRFDLRPSPVVAPDLRTASSFRMRPSRKKIVRKLRRLQYLFGAHGPCFDVRVLVDEVIELVFQAFAAHASSRSISNEALNLTYGLVIMLNSLSTVVFRSVYHAPRHLIKQRVARLLTDLVLDFMWGALLPLWMMQPILQSYFQQRNHGVALGFAENSARVFVLSWWNFVMSIVPFCSSLFNLAKVRSLLREEFQYQPTDA